MLLCSTKESDERTSKPLFHSQPVITCEYVSIEYDERSGNEPSQFCVSELTDHGKNSKSDVEMKLPIKEAGFDFVPCS